MEYTAAVKLAEEARELLAPYCQRIEIAGSVRRRKAQPNDLELVAIPRLVPSGLFGDEAAVDPEFCAAVNRWAKVKGEPTGKYTQRVLPGGMTLDLFMADAENWGALLAIRTGSADFSHQVFARRWVKLGYTSIKGRLTRDGVVTPVYEEYDLFVLLGIPYVEPWQREVSNPIPF